MKIKKDERLIVTEEFLNYMEHCLYLMKVTKDSEKEEAMDWVAYVTLSLLLESVPVQVLRETLVQVGRLNEVTKCLSAKPDKPLPGLH